LRTSHEDAANRIEYGREIKSIKKDNQEESLAQQEEWGRRFQSGVA